MSKHAEHDNLVAYLDGELDEETARSLEARMNTDPALREEVDSLRQAWDLLDYLPRAEPSASFTNRTMQRLPAQRPASTMLMPAPCRRWSRWLLSTGWAAGIVLAAAIGFGAARQLWPRPDFPTDARLQRVLESDLRVIENQPLYEHIDDIDYLKQLNTADLFENK